MPRDCRRSSESGFDATVIQESYHERRQAEGGFNAAVIEESPRESRRLANGKELTADSVASESVIIFRLLMRVEFPKPKADIP